MHLFSPAFSQFQTKKVLTIYMFRNSDWMHPYKKKEERICQRIERLQRLKEDCKNHFDYKGYKDCKRTQSIMRFDNPSSKQVVFFVMKIFIFNINENGFEIKIKINARA
jgi:hypothetical protein